jgi:hypothetical protein
MVMVSAVSTVPRPQTATDVVVDKQNVAVSGFVGFGAEWDPYPRKSLPVPPVVQQRIGAMKLPLIRTRMFVNWYTKDAVRYDFNSGPMQRLYANLDVARQQGITVILTDWCRGAWTGFTFGRMDNPAYAKALARGVEHLTKSKGYTNIKYFVMCNEPNFNNGGGFQEYEAGMQNLSREWADHDLQSLVKLTGPDESGSPTWLDQTSTRLSNQVGAYDAHYYASSGAIQSGAFEGAIRSMWRSVSQDASAGRKDLLITEAGVSENTDNNSYILTYEYGLNMADYAVQAVRAGTKGVVAWMLDDEMYGSPNWGMWSDAAHGRKLKPFFYPWSLATKLFPPGMTMYNVSSPAGVRIIAGSDPARGWSFAVVNRNSSRTLLNLKVPSGGSLTYDSYLYSPRRAPADGDGIPLPTSTGVSGNLSNGVQVKVPANSVAFVSGLRPVPSDSGRSPRRQAPVARSGRASHLVVAVLLTLLATTVFLMATAIVRARRRVARSRVSRPEP